MEQHDDGAFSTEDWVAAKPATFDFSKEYEAEVFPKLKEIEAICQQYGIPFFTRFFFEQSPNGNSSSTVSYLGGAERATPELLALTLLNELDHDTPMQVAGLMMAAVQKFSGEDSPAGIFMP